MENPFLSIITINYNNLDGLKRTVRSVLDQSYTNYEYIIVDGDSTDGSKEFISENTDHFRCWVSESDNGIYNAMNKGIDMAQGQYFLFLNSGDTLNGKDALNEFIGHKEFGGDIVYGDYKFDNGHKVYADHLTPYYFVRTSLPHQSTLFKRRVFDIMGKYDESYRIISDRVFFTASYLSEKFEFRHIRYPLVHFDLKGLSNDMEYRNQKLAEDDRMFRELFGIYYEDYMSMRQMERDLYLARRNTLPGLIKRIKRKFMK